MHQPRITMNKKLSLREKKIKNKNKKDRFSTSNMRKQVLKIKYYLIQNIKHVIFLFSNQSKMDFKSVDNGKIFNAPD